MTNIFVINGGQKFGHSGGRFNETITDVTVDFFTNHPDFEVRMTVGSRISILNLTDQTLC